MIDYDPLWTMLATMFLRSSVWNQSRFEYWNATGHGPWVVSYVCNMNPLLGEVLSGEKVVY